MDKLALVLAIFSFALQILQAHLCNPTFPASSVPHVVCKHVCPLCDCVHGKGQHQLGLREMFLKEVLFSQPHAQTWLTTHHLLMYSRLCSRALRLGWETMKRYPRTLLSVFAIRNLHQEEGATKLGVSLLFLPVQNVYRGGWFLPCMSRNRRRDSYLSGVLIKTKVPFFILLIH